MEEEKAMAIDPTSRDQRGAPPIAADDTLATYFWRAVEWHGERVIMRQKTLGIWQAQTWRELGEIAREIGLGLVSLGLAPGNVVSILSNTNREWAWTDLGTLGAAGVVNGIYPTDAAVQVEFLLADSSSKFVFVEDEEQLDKVLEVRDRLPHLTRTFVFDMEGLQGLADDRVESLDRLRERGRAFMAAHPDEWLRRVGLRKPDDLAILVYTSGTTGKPKGAMISHRNLLATCDGYQQSYPQFPTDERMCFLPLCHIAERVGGLYHSVISGAVLNFVENPDTVPENVREIQPTVFTAVPRVWEKFYSGVQIGLAEATPLERWAYRLAIDIGMRRAALIEAGKPIGAALAIAFRLARFLVLDNVRKLIGIHRSRVLVTGAAPISPDLVRWYIALGLPMCEVWGQTESTGAITANASNAIRPGSIGPRMHHAEVAISPDGELIARGPSIFMGYLNQPDKTAETLKDGWLHTGDVGRVDADGYFFITDRMKDIIITAGGKNITPSEIENQLKFSPYITDAVVIGDRRAYLTAIIMIDHENVERYAQEHNIPFSNYASLTARPEIVELIAAEVERVNKTLARVETVKKFRLLDRKLTAEDEELTPTMKLKRKLVNEKYRELIDEMYRSAA